MAPEKGRQSINLNNTKHCDVVVIMAKLSFVPVLIMSCKTYKERKNSLLWVHNMICLLQQNSASGGSFLSLSEPLKLHCTQNT